MKTKSNTSESSSFIINLDRTAGGADIYPWIDSFPEVVTVNMVEDGRYSFSLDGCPKAGGIFAETFSTLAARLFGQPLAEGKTTIIVENTLEHAIFYHRECNGCVIPPNVLLERIAQLAHRGVPVFFAGTEQLAGDLAYYLMKRAWLRIC